ncbi:MAG: LCP family protein, partial [Clostridia bacterium]|nr:LCP family protein [Clostridia bacterium]
MIFDTRDNVSLWLRILAVALAIAILICGSFLLAWQLYFGQMTGERYQSSGGLNINDSEIREGEGDQGEDLQTLEPIPTYSDDPNNDRNAEEIHPTELSGLKANIKSWINTGEPVHDSHVTNILVIGMDNQYETGGAKSAPLTTNGRADAMVVLSINHQTRKITMASLMRDQYAYLVVGNKGSFEKLHHALIYGGPSLQVQMVERYYKIVIDNYVIVNFESVTNIIDALGGITVDVEPNVAQFLNENCGFHIRSGENTFDGSHALVYMRIRRGNTGGDLNTAIELVDQFLTETQLVVVTEGTHSPY